ncbi:MAG: translin family protein [Candidatus Bathyarchaeia archaeon]
MRISRGDLRRIQKEIRDYDLAREKLLELSRTATRISSQSIMRVHRGDPEGAMGLAEEARGLIKAIGELLKENPVLNQLGYALVAQQEYAEARCLLSILSEGRLPSLREVGVGSMPYVLGLLDLIGELRRNALDKLRDGRLEEAEGILETIEGIYEDLLSLDHTPAVPTFRKKMDVARKLIELTRGDMISESKRASLEGAIRDLKSELDRWAGSPRAGPAESSRKRSR